LGLEAAIEVSEDDEGIVARLDGDDLGQLIGRRGQTIDAVQLICYRAALAGGAERRRVIVDAAGYREQRRQAVERQADRAAERALGSGKEIELEPMSPTERRIVHQHLKDRAGVETFSEGTEPVRFVVVAPLVAD
jgi:spoIIIJ-associated protein